LELIVPDELKLILQVLGIEKDGSKNLKYIQNNIKNYQNLIYDSKKVILEDDQLFLCEGTENQTKVIFNLFDKEASCSHLIINDCIYFYLRNLFYIIFNQIITIKDNIFTPEIHYFDMDQLDKLKNPTQNTIDKFYNLYLYIL